MAHDVYSANRRLEMAFLMNRINLQNRPVHTRPGLCDSCAQGVHNCSGKVLKITMIYDLKNHDNDRVEREEIPCLCYKCRVSSEHTDD